MTPEDFGNATFPASEVDCAWHLYAALLTYGLSTPQAQENPAFTAAVKQQKFMFDMMFERMEH